MLVHYLKQKKTYNFRINNYKIFYIKKKNYTYQDTFV